MEELDHKSSSGDRTIKDLKEQLEEAQVCVVYHAMCSVFSHIMCCTIEMNYMVSCTCKAV